jgi:hypothetical protein
MPPADEYYYGVMDDVDGMTTLRNQRSFSKRLLDFCLLIGSALLVCTLAVGAFVITEIHHVSPVWVFLSLISFGFLVGVVEEYRKEFRSLRFILFVCGWLVINIAVFAVVLSSFGWIYLIPALFLEQVLFYMTAYWLFGLQPPLSRHRTR